MSVQSTTFYYERWRAISAGILETAGVTFLLLIAVRVFHADTTSKALVAAGGNIGLLLTPFVVSRVEASGWDISKAGSLFAIVGCVAFLFASTTHWLPLFVICAMIGTASSAAVVPLLTQIYQSNYPTEGRGKLFSQTVMIRVATAMVFSELGGVFLSGHLERFSYLLVIFAIAAAFSGVCLFRCPSRPLSSSGKTHPFRALRYLKTDKIFRWTLVSWMIMGFANLMMLPMRVEYLANPRYGLHLEVATIAILTGVVPNFARLMVSPIWGWCFDRMNFFLLRIILNLGFILGILSFFTGQSKWGLILGSLVIGISLAGGDVAWSLWVTKFAPADRVADYMSVHTFFTGIRGVLAPMVAFHLSTGTSMAKLGWISAGLIMLASLMLLPEIKFGKRGRSAEPLVEEISD
jgi:MFS family permease